VNQTRSLFETSLFSPFGQSLLVKNRIGMLERLRREALKAAADPSIGLVFLHDPVPHAPHTYDRVQRAFTKRNAPFDGYLDSLALADLILGEIREAMTASGVWDTTTLLVSADHPYRASRQLDGKSDPRVPFLMKLSAQKSAVEYCEPLQTLVSKRLLESVLRGEVSTPQEALAWLRANSLR
jgi:arylsulfatase A-like enzyme